MKKSLVVMAVVIMALVLGGCAKVPQAEIDAANAAIEKAKLAEADVYLQTDYTALLDSMNAINATVEAKKGKLFASLSSVKPKLAAVTADATALVGKTEAKKEQIKQEVNDLITKLQALATENNALVAKAPKGKEGKAAIEAIKGELTTIDQATAELSQLVASGSLMAADTKAKAAFDKATSINTELKDVIDKAKGGKKK
jgi:hypothetical protein